MEGGSFMKKLFFFCLLLFVSFCISSLEFGGSLSNTTGITNESNTTELVQQNQLSLYFKAVGKNFNAVGGGSYIFTPDRPFLIGLDTFYLQGQFPVAQNELKKFTFTLGRFALSDPTNLILQHRIDGIRFGFGYTNTQFIASTGFSGLILHPRSTITMTRSDLDPWMDYFASPRLIGLIQFNINNLFITQSVRIFAAFQEDLNPDSMVIDAGTQTYQADNGGKLDTQYAGLTIFGPVITNFKYSLYGAYNFGRTLSYLPDSDSATNFSYQYTTVSGFLFGGTFVIDIPDFLHSSISLSGIYGSGDADYSSYTEGNSEGRGTMFLPITITQLGNIFSPKPGNISVIGLQYEMMPFINSGNMYMEKMKANVDTLLFFRNTTGPISESGIDPASTEKYLATEIDLSITMQPFSDLTVGFKSGILFRNAGNGGAFSSSIAPTALTAGITGVLYF